MLIACILLYPILGRALLQVLGRIQHRHYVRAPYVVDWMTISIPLARKAGHLDYVHLQP